MGQAHFCDQREKGSRNLFRQNSLLATKNIENDKKVPGTFFSGD